MASRIPVVSALELTLCSENEKLLFTALLQYKRMTGLAHLSLLQPAVWLLSLGMELQRIQRIDNYDMAFAAQRQQHTACSLSDQALTGLGSPPSAALAWGPQ